MKHYLQTIGEIYIYTTLLFFLFHCNSSLETIQNDASSRFVSITNRNSDVAFGSGFFVNSTTIVTCYHVIYGYEDNIRITLDGKTYFPARVIGKEEKLDFVLLRTAEEFKISKINWANNESIKSGNKVFAFSSAYSLKKSYTEGYISHTDRTGLDAQFKDIPMIQTIGISFPGSSGSAVYNFQGEIVGMNRSTYGNAYGSGIGFVIPAIFIQAAIQLHLQ